MRFLMYVILLILAPTFAHGGTLCQDTPTGGGGSTRALTTSNTGDLLWNPQLTNSTQGGTFTQYVTPGSGYNAPSLSQGSGMVQVVNGHDDPINCDVEITGWSCEHLTGGGSNSGIRIIAFIRHAFNLSLSRSQVMALDFSETSVNSGVYSRSVRQTLPSPVKLTVGDHIMYSISSYSNLGSSTVVCYMHWKKL